MTDNHSYQTRFEKLQRIKNELLDTNQSQEYKEDKEYFYAKSHKVKKREYAERSKSMKKLRTSLRKLYDQYVEIRGLYLHSRSNAYDDAMRKNFEQVNEAAEMVRRKTLEHEATPDQIFDIVNDPDSPPPQSQTFPANTTAPPSSAEKTRSKSKSKEKRVKRFLFTTYKQCISQKRSEPTYMSKEEIIAHIRKHDPSLLKHLPKNLRAMKKEDICKVIIK